MDKCLLPDFDKLAPLEYVDAGVFESADPAEQAVCDFILTLALVHNDLKDFVWAFVEIKDRCPLPFELTPQAGQLYGMREHYARLLYGLHHELLELINRNPEPMIHKLFTDVLSRISRESRKHWNSMVLAASGKPKDDPLAMMLVRVRNDIAFHYYGTTVLARGFKKQYDGSAVTGRALYVSRGVNMTSTRFYFADGAAQGAMRHLSEGKTKEEIGDKLGALTQSMRTAINAIVTRFMEDRAGGWTRA